ncbi:DNA polymerase III epsilon subunit-like protein [Arthrobacter globiformis]|uniref:exonuclease domain-containing protein n=1 Tax=Arthrobacter globiformis TaxID=1665 RepID=UPI0027825396|nr:exonuclease domain-containing protein [Arthrobacter globiformis]MDQ1057444.1 DNA polymerase III epsilon subunit-like protein [Arthrobacter globiformis]
MSGISFTAIDFETANSHRGSACAVGLVKVRDGHIVDTASWLIKPPPGIDDFDPINVELHGIAEQDVQNAADWEMSLEGILQFVCEDPLVAFDAAYDASVMRKATEHQHLDLPATDFYCALHLAQDHLTLPRHHLSDVLAALDLPPVGRHEPQSHALACAQIVLAIAATRGFSTLAEVWEQPTTAVGKRRRGRRVRTDADPDAEAPGAGRAEPDAASEGRDEPDANLAVAPHAGPEQSADRIGTAEAGRADAGTAYLLQLNRAEVERADFDSIERNATAKPKAAKRAFSTAAGLVLFALGVAAAVGLAYLTGLTIRFFAAGQTVTAAMTLAAATATMWATWASITRGWHRLRPAPDPL